MEPARPLPARPPERMAAGQPPRPGLVEKSSPRDGEDDTGPRRGSGLMAFGLPLFLEFVTLGTDLPSAPKILQTGISLGPKNPDLSIVFVLGLRPEATH